MRLVLASVSPRRAELLSAAGIPFAVQPVDADESPRGAETPDAYVRRIARAKADAAGPPDPGTVILAADTTVTIDGLILGKPADDREAAATLARLAGRTHRVLTAIVLAHAPLAPAPLAPAPLAPALLASDALASDALAPDALAPGSQAPAPLPHAPSLQAPPGGGGQAEVHIEDLAVTDVTFHPLSAEAIAWYVASGEPRDKAGAYAIQGLGSRFVARLDGSYPNVVGLPIDLVCRHLARLAPSLLAHARPGGAARSTVVDTTPGAPGTFGTTAERARTARDSG